MSEDLLDDFQRNQNKTDFLNHASLKDRSLAFSLDLIFCFIAVAMLVEVTFFLGVIFPMYFYFMLFAISLLLWLALPESFSTKASLGKRMIGLEVIHAESGLQISIGQAFFRNLIKFPLALFSLWSYAMKGLRIMIHDRQSNTFVIRVKP